MPLPTVAVIGGGIAGLACAHRLKELSKKKFEVVLLEGSARLGGTVETERADGFLLEKGPDAFIRDKPWALDLAKRLGLEDQMINTRQTSRQSFVFRDGRFIALPEGFYLIAPVKLVPFLASPLFSLPGKLRMLLEPFIPARRSDQDESLSDFVRRRFGVECLERCGQPMLGGIYTGDPDKLGILSTLPRFRDLEKRHGSLFLGLRREMKKSMKDLEAASGARYSLFISFKNGMRTLTDALEKALPEGVARLNTTAQNIRYDRSQKIWDLSTSNGVLRVHSVVCALPARIARTVFRESLPELSEELSKLSYESVATVSLAYRKDQLKRPKRGFGFVTPKTEKKAVIACTFTDQKFEGRAPEDSHLFRAFVGGAFGREYFARMDKEIMDLAEKELESLFDIKGPPVLKRIQRHRDSMVQYFVGHLDWLASIDRLTNDSPGLFLAGASYAGVGIPDCVRDAESKAEKAALFLDSIEH